MKVLEGISLFKEENIHKYVNKSFLYSSFFLKITLYSNMEITNKVLIKQGPPLLKYSNLSFIDDP